ncbi:MAG: phage tail tube protein [Pirellulales bacterium]
MANEHIGRKQSIGLGKESTPGTGVAAGIWIPKLSGAFTPKVTTTTDDGAYGVIDKVRDVQTVQVATDVTFSAVLRDVYFGHMLMAALGLSYATVKFPIPGSITGTFVEGETITESTSSATGVLRRADVGGASKALYISVTSGTFTGGETLTGGTSGATATGGTIESPSALRWHVFRRDNTNTNVSYTIYGSDPISDDRATFCLLDTLDVECVVGNFAKFTAKFMGKKLASTSAQTPSFTSQNGFLAKFASCKLASAFIGLDAASALEVESYKLSIKKNLGMYQSLGSTDLTSIHNQQFGEITGEIVLLYRATTQRDLVLNSTKQAMRLTMANTDVTIGSGTNPTVQFDLPKVQFMEFSRSTENDNLVRQTLKFTAEYDTTTALTIQALLANTQVTAF